MAIRDYRPTTRAPGAPAVTQINPSVAGNQSGAQQLAGAMGETGMRIRQAQIDTELNDARQAMIEGISQINQDLAKDNDFRGMSDRYGVRLAELQEASLKGISSDRAKERFETEFMRGRISTEAGVLRRELDLQGSHVRGAIIQGSRSAANGIAQASSPEQAAEIFANYQMQLDTAVENGFMTAEEADRQKIQFDGEVSNTLFLTDLNDDPSTALSKLENHGYGFDEEDRQLKIAQAQRAVKQITSQRDSVLSTKTDRAVRILHRGEVVAPDELKALQADVAGTSYEVKLNGAIRAKNELGGFSELTPAEQADRIKEVEGQGLSLDEDTEDRAYLNGLKAIHKNTVEQLQKDPINYAIGQSFQGAAPLDLGNQNSVNSRIATAETLFQDYGAPARLLTDQEIETFKGVFDADNVDDQLDLVVSLKDSFGDEYSPYVFEELGKIDPVVQRAGELVFETQDVTLSRIILNGRIAMKSGDELNSPREDTLVILEENLDGAMMQMPGKREIIFETAKAYYAAQAPGRVSVDNPRSQIDLMTEAVQKAAGQVTINGRQYGGVQTVNGKNTKLPATLDGETVTLMLRQATADHWKAANGAGAIPHDGIDELVEATAEGARLEWMGGDTYALVRENGYYSRPPTAEELAIDKDAANVPFTFSLTALQVAMLQNPPKDSRMTDPLYQGAVP